MNQKNPIPNGELPKLVRDNILQIIRDNEKQEPIYHVAESDSEFESFLKKKIIEEAKELSKVEGREAVTTSIVDVVEVIDALKKLQNITDEEIMLAKENKNIKVGSFTKRYILEGKK